MQDQDLKKLLLETCPIRPGQESRAWAGLHQRLYGNQQSTWSWLFVPTWRGFKVTAVMAGLVTAVAALLTFSLVQQMAANTMGYATADSQAPGVYATAFYSKPAKAQVVWLNGMEPATDKPTYLDPTTVVPKKNTPPPRDPNTL